MLVIQKANLEDKDEHKDKDVDVDDDKEEEEDEEEEESESESEESESDVLSESVLDPELDDDSSDDDGVGARRFDRVVLVGGLDEAFPSSVLERFLGGLLVPAITTTGRELVYKES